MKDKLIRAVTRLARRRKIEDVQQFDGPTSCGGATMNVYFFDDGTMETREYNWQGAELLRYDGEPRDVPPGTAMPPAPPRPPGAAPLPPPIEGPR